jgi:hypothetical protein
LHQVLATRQLQHFSVGCLAAAAAAAAAVDVWLLQLCSQAMM